ncbi:MAG: hypothetical protein IPJ01_12155 [Micavibrio sp.]|nr:hypothetical protein [Micavibrio sp.]
MNDAQQVLHVAQAFLEELLDGIDFVVTVKNRQTGELEELPIGIRIKPKGEDGVEQQPITTQ